MCKNERKRSIRNNSNAFGLLDASILHGDGTMTIAKKGGDNIGYSGHEALVIYNKSDVFNTFSPCCSLLLLLTLYPEIILLHIII